MLDCTDHPTSRYLISDAAVVAGKPVVSASALRTEGQLLVLNYPPSTFPQRDTGFCYRCVYPRPPPAENVTGCGESGILGPVVGVMGVLMAVEAIRLITNPSSSSQPNITDRQTLLFYSAYSSPTFRTIRLRGKRPDCASCSASTIINRRTFTNGNLNYATFCGLNSLPNLLPNQNRISAVDYHKLSQDANGLHTLVDVREKPQFDMCHLDHSLNIPYSTIAAYAEEPLVDSDNVTPEQLLFKCLRASKGSIYFICRYGNDSQLAVQKLQNSTRFKQGDRVMQDIKGGLAAWRREVDSSFPDY